LNYIYINTKTAGLKRKLFTQGDFARFATSAQPYNPLDIIQNYLNDIDKILISIHERNIKQYLSLYKLKINISHSLKQNFERSVNQDVDYYTKLMKLTNTLDNKNKRVLKKINGMEIDLENIMRIFRLKKYYEFEPDYIYPFLIPYNHKLSPEITRNMIKVKSIEELSKIIANTKYSKVFDQE